jgi:hypothetical protein
MAMLFAALKLAGADNALRARLAAMFQAFKRDVDEDILRRHDEAVLHSLDKRVRHDAGIVDLEEETTSKTCQKDLGVLATLFSWTRFSK